MREHDLPRWERGATIKSIRDLGSLALDTIANLIRIKDIESDD